MTARTIPTKYDGTQFRSRLEARWAAFFGLVGWRWEYEPLDLNGWIPDFALIGKKETTLVEVKPVAWRDDPVAVQACSKAERAVHDSGHPCEILLLGFAWSETIAGGSGVGWLCEWYDASTATGACWAVAPFSSLGGIGFHHDYASYHNRITGEYDGDAGAFAEAPLELWREAGNATQWQPTL